MKKILILILIILLMASLISCGGEQAIPDGEQNGPQGENVSQDVVLTETTNLTDDSWKKTASEDELDSYYDVLYSDTDTAQKVRIASLSLFKSLAAKDIAEGKNTMISPLSFLTAMGLLENGAAGDSLKEIETAFGYDIGSFNDWYDAWSKLIMLYGGEALNVANSVWYKADPTLVVSEDYLKKAAEIYDAQAFEAPFDDKTLEDINGWVNDNTKGMIPAILDNISKDAMMFLINATCFEGSWYEDYKDDQIKENEIFTREDGTEEKATLLYSHEMDSRFYENEFLTGASRAYRNGFRISFFLPKEGVTVGEALTKLDGDMINDLMTNGILADVDLMIPEFGFDYSVPGCADALKSMGIVSVFDEDDADLSPMAVTTDKYNLYVDQVIHKTHIELDREGTKAAAATAIGIAKATAIMEEEPVKKEVRLDRPFIFVISDSQTSTPIFMGTVGSVEQ